MKNFCTVADFNFLNRVLALNKSLKKYSDKYILHLLCLDDQIFNSINDENIKLYKLENLYENDKSLFHARNNDPSREALINSAGNIDKAKRLQFIWTLSPYFTWYCLDTLECDDVLYIDADIYFFSNWENLYKHLDKISVGIVEHRCETSTLNGKYNVGIVYFKNDINGYKCLTWWKNCLLFTDHQYYSTHSSCGDQKYLELFPELFQNVSVLDKFIGHLAPWNFNQHLYKKDKILWNNLEQDLLYCHFSNFKTDFDKNTYTVAERHGIVKPSNDFIKKICDEYYESLKETKC
jgi:hypothetical protein